MESRKNLTRRREVTSAVILAITSILLISAVSALPDKRLAGRRPVEAAVNTSDPYRNFKSPCGSALEVSERVGRCLDPIFELVEGRSKIDPKSDQDLLSCCDRFANTEKCVRNVAKECLSGIAKTSTSTVASAIRRFRINECKSVQSRAKYADPLRCALKKSNDMIEVFKESTAMSQAIRDYPNVTPEERLMKICCLLLHLDKQIENEFNSACPKSTPAVLGIVHAITDDARSTLCVNPKCNNALDASIRNRKYQPKQNLIEPVAQVLYQLGAGDDD